MLIALSSNEGSGELTQTHQSICCHMDVEVGLVQKLCQHGCFTHCLQVSLLIIFKNSLDPVQVWQNIGRDLDSNSLTLWWYSQISVIRTPIIRNYWVIRRRWTVPNFFSIIYCNKTTNYSNFDYPKNSIFRSDSSVPIEESAIKLPFKIRSPKVTHGDHDFFVWSSSIYTPEWISKQSCNR